MVEGLPPLVVQETTSASSVQQSTRNLLSTGVELLSNSRASEASDLVNKSMISPQSKVILPSPVKLVTNNNKRFMNGQLQQQQQTHNNAFDELNGKKIHLFIYLFLFRLFLCKNSESKTENKRKTIITFVCLCFLSNQKFINKLCS